VPIDFKLPERIVGINITTGKEGEQILVRSLELLGPDDPALVSRLQEIDGPIFSKIPGIPNRSQIDHVLVVIRDDLSATAYVNELNAVAQVKLRRTINKGDPVFESDIEDIVGFSLGVDVPDDCAFVLLRSHGWARSLLFDFSPLTGGSSRTYQLGDLLVKQALALVKPIRIPVTPQNIQDMTKGLHALEMLISSKCEKESSYQELLESNAWMFGGIYSSVKRHSKFDDKNIPDFTASRAADGFMDIIELKHPFLRCFTQSGFSSEFNDSWNQAERYASFCIRNAAYLRSEKQMEFDQPRCILLMGFDLSSEQEAEIRNKNMVSSSVKFMSYDHLLRQAKHVLELFEAAARAPSNSPEVTQV
jgi:hypothetical protein